MTALAKNPDGSLDYHAMMAAPKLIEGVKMLQQGCCSMHYLHELCSLGETMQLASKCGLGQMAPNAFLSIVEHFQDEILGRIGRVG